MVRVSLNGAYRYQTQKDWDVDTSGKPCPVCEEFKTWDQYVKTGRGPCKTCVGDKNAKVHPAHWRILDAKRRAKAAGLPFDLDQHEPEIMHRVLRGCELTGLPFDFSLKGGRGNRNPYSLSIDRIEGGRGYVLSNCRFILWGLNVAFNNWGDEAFEVIARAWLERKSFPC